MEDVIVFLLFAYLFVLRPILKRLRKADAGPGASPKRSLSQWLDTLQQKLREAAEQASTRPTGQTAPEVLPEGEMQVSGSPVQPPSMAEIPGIWRAERQYLERDSIIPSGPPTEPAPATQSVRPPQVEMGVQPEVPVAARRGRSRISLRQAVVWSEILGPPLALRD